VCFLFSCFFFCHKEPAVAGTDVEWHARRNGDQYFLDFVEPPPRSLKSYYRVIEHPMALKKLHNMVRGISGRSFTGISEFKTWEEFEATASLLWRNAYLFNEDESEIFLIARDLEVSALG